MPENVVMTDQWQDVVAAANLSASDERTLVARDNPVEIYPDPAGAAVPAGARGDALYPGTSRRVADRPLFTVDAGATLWARRLHADADATLVLTET